MRGGKNSSRKEGHAGSVTSFGASFTSEVSANDFLRSFGRHLTTSRRIVDHVVEIRRGTRKDKGLLASKEGKEEKRAKNTHDSSVILYSFISTCTIYNILPER